MLEKYFFHKPSTAHVQYDYLDGLRGIAVLYVLLSHLASRGMHTFPGINFAGSGKYGVFLFFTLSAFLLTLPMLKLSYKELKNKDIWLNYGIRRILRIFPLFLVVLTVSYLFSRSGYFIRISGPEYLDHMLLQKGKDVFWTIPVEFKYYFVLPVVASIFMLLKKQLLPSALFICVSLIVVTHFIWPSAESQMNTVILGPYLPIFLLGSFAALLLDRVSQEKWVNRASFKLTAEIVAYTTMACSFLLVPDILRGLLDRNIHPFSFHKEFLLFGIIWSLFIVSCHLGVGVIRRILSAKPIRFVGIISFSLYLWHMPVIFFFARYDIAPLVKAWSIIFAAIVLSSVSYLIIEKPFLKVGFNFLNSRKSISSPDGSLQSAKVSDN